MYIMLKSKLLLITGLFFVAGMASLQAATKLHDIKFSIAGLKNTICFLGYHYGDKDYILDTAKVDEKGNFEFSGEK